MGRKSITTGTGDKGKTRLFSGEELSKNSLRIETLGDIDELVSFLGIAKNHCKKEETTEPILFVQKSLFTVASEIAARNKAFLKKSVDKELMKELEERLKLLEMKVEIPDSFIVPGKNPGSAYLDFSRALARRCERKIVKLFNENMIENEIILAWANRLSDYLYILARYEEV